MFRLGGWVLWGVLAGAVWADPYDPRFTCSDRLLGMTQAILGAQSALFHIASEPVAQMLARPAFRPRLHTVLALHDWLRSETAFGRALARRLSDPAYSSADADRHSLLRERAIDESLAETQFSLPPEARALLLQGLLPFARTYDLNGPEIAARVGSETEQVFASVGDAELVALYQAWRLDESSAVLMHGTSVLANLNTDAFRRVVRTKDDARSSYPRYRGALLRYAVRAVDKFNETLQPRPTSDIDLVDAFSVYLHSRAIPYGARAFFCRLMRARCALNPHWSGTNVVSKLSVFLVTQLAELRRELLLVQRQECENCSPAVATQNACQGVCVQSLRRSPNRPVSNRRRKEEAAPADPVRELASGSTALAPQELPLLSEDEIEALFSRFSPTTTHYSKFLKAMDRAKRKLSPSLFLKFRQHIVFALQQLEAKVPPQMVRGLYPAQRGVWEHRPLGTSTTDRFFVGQVGNTFFILCLCSDVKSGNDKEHKMIMGLEQEVRVIERQWREGV